jgi:hypothetical protein
VAAVAMAILVWGATSLLEPWLPVPGVILTGAVIGILGYVAALRVVAPAILRTAVALVKALLRRDQIQLETILAQRP